MSRSGWASAARPLAAHQDLLTALGLAGVTLLSRWPYRARMLYVLPLGIGDVEHAGYSFVRDEW